MAGRIASLVIGKRQTARRYMQPQMKCPAKPACTLVRLSFFPVASSNQSLLNFAINRNVRKTRRTSGTDLKPVTPTAGNRTRPGAAFRRLGVLS